MSGIVKGRIGVIALRKGKGLNVTEVAEFRPRS